MDTSPTLLIAGFGPFPGVPDNPAAAVVSRLEAEGWSPAGVGAAYAVLPTTWAGAAEALRDALDRTAATGVLLVGVAAQARSLRVELQARNFAATHRPDALGVRCASDCVLEEGPEVLACTAPVWAMIEAIRAEGLLVEPSSDAGDYLCNYTLYHALADARAGGAAFLHLPPPGPETGFSAADLERAVCAAARAYAAALVAPATAALNA